MTDKQDLIRIQEYSLEDFLVKFQSLVKQGYELKLEHNDSYPVQIGNMLCCGVFGTEGEEEALVDTQGVNSDLIEEVVETKPIVKQRGRQAK